MNRDLFTFFEDNAVFTDFSKAARDYLRDPFNISYVTADSDALYHGLYKPFRQLYLEIDTINVASTGAVSFTYYNGTSFVALEVNDETNDIARSGFVSFEPPTDWALTTINGEELFFIKITNDADFDITFKGINTVFSDDNDLLSESRTIMDQRAVGDTSFISYHLASRNEIIQSLRNGGHITRVSGIANSRDLTKWDILIPDQVRNASKYLTLSKIMFDVSSNVDDKWYAKFKDYRDMYSEAFKLYLMSLDDNDNGELDAVEANNFRTIEFIKV